MINFLNDIVSGEDCLGYYPYIEAFNYILVNNSNLITPPLVFGIHGKWGSGKTTFMNLIKKRIEKGNKFYIVEINPWEYGNSQNFITIFLAKLYEEVKNKVKLFGSNSGMDFIKSVFKPLKLCLDAQPLKVEYDFEKFSLDQQQDAINKLISENFALKESVSYILNHKFISQKKIVVFIDDLDRCDVNKVMEVIESIKLIFNSKNCIFFLGCDINYLQCALSNRYKSFIEFSKENNNEPMSFDLSDFSREYLEKIIQIPFYIPPIDGKSVKKYIKSIIECKETNNRRISPKEDIFEKFKKDLEDDFISELIIAIDINPRRIKRILNLTFLNYVFLKFKNIERNNLKINTKLLAFLCVLREVYPKFYKEELSHELSCRNVFESFFEIYLKEKSDSERNDLGIAENYEINSKILSMKDIDETNSNMEIYNSRDVENKIHNLFELYFRYRNIKEIKMLNEELYYISLYISVSNLTASENDSESEWGSLVKIRSEITGKKLIVFLEMLSDNLPAKNLIYWFFSSVYSKETEKYILGIVKNVNIYLRIDEKRKWMFKFDFNKNNNTLEIIFDWKNEFKLSLKNLDQIIKSTKYNSISKKVQVDEETTSNELEIIKEDLINVVNLISFSYSQKINSNEIASTKE